MNLDINIYVILGILFMHWVADFVCQTDWQASNKSTNMIALLMHTGTYSFIWFPMMILIWAMENTTLLSTGHPSELLKFAGLFTIITFIVHTITDYFTSRLNTKLHQKGDIHNFFVSIGFDQWLHYIQLFVTYLILR